jgi:uncharacterized membrane protein (DUF2068 family)
MNDLLQKLDVWLKPVNDVVFSNLQASQLVRYVAIAMLVLGVLGLCGGLGLITAGGLGAITGAVGGGVLNEAAQEAGVNQQEAEEALRQLGQVSGTVIFWGFLTVISAPLLVIAAVGLFQRQSWGRMAAVIALAVNAVVSLLGIFMGGGLIGNVISFLLYGYLAYLFYHHSAMKQEFGAS